MSQLRDYIGRTDAKVLSFTANFGQIITSQPGTYNLSVQDCQDYQTLQSNFAAKLTAATDPLTRGKRTVFLKQEAKKELVALTRKYAQQITKLVTITDDQRQALGLTIPSGERHPVPVPSSEPVVIVKKTQGRNVTLELRQEANKRGRPAKVSGATVFSFIGPVAPMTNDGWKFEGSTTKTTFDVEFGPSSTGDTVWFTAFWKNSRDQTGPAATPVSVNLPAGGALPSGVSEVEETEETWAQEQTETKRRGRKAA